MQKFKFPFILLIILSGLFIFPKSSYADIATGLAGYWKFDETSGTTAADSSGSGNNGTLTNGPTWTTGRIDNALSFDGTNDYVTMGDPTNSSLDFPASDFSLSVWVLTPAKDTSSATHLITGKWTYNTLGNGGYGLATRYGKYTLQMGSGSGVCNSILWYGSNNSLNDLVGGTWEHVVATFDRDGYIRLYVNGTQSYSKDISAASACDLSNPYPFTVGSRDSGGTFFQGSIDEVRIYNRALSASDVQELYSYNSHPAGPITYYVSTSGNDSNPGTQSQPWQTIQKAANSAMAGDTVIVNTGIYNERIQLTKSGSFGAPITFQALGTVVMKGFNIPVNYIMIKGFEIANTDYVRWHSDVSAGVYILGNNVVVENNYVHDCSLSGIVLAGSPHDNTQTVTHDCIIRNNRLYRNEMVGINVAGRNNLIENNEVWGTVQCHPNVVAVEGAGCPNYPAVGGLDADGMRFFGSGHVFRKNYVHDIVYGPAGVNPEIGDYNDNPHIDCFQTWAGTYTETASNIIFEQNRCNLLVSQAAHENGHGFMLDGAANNLTIRNNIFKTYCGINTGGQTGAHHLYIYNNIWANNLSFNQFWPCAIGLSNAPYSIVKNNIFYDQPYHTIVSTGDTTGQDIDYNLAFNSDGSTPDCFRVGD